MENRGAVKRFTGLDGIKGLALTAIVLYHCIQQRLPGGFYGVDVFFTVSGFLIATSLFRSLHQRGSLNLKRYVAHRLSRLYPALILMIPVMATLGLLIDRDALVSIKSQIITALFGGYNWYAIIEGQSYFDQMNPQIFRHLWFISVLIQFYIIVPLVAWAMWRIRRTHYASLVPLGLAALSAGLIWLLYQPGQDPTRVYFGTDTHSMGLMLGVALAWWVSAAQSQGGRTPVRSEAAVQEPQQHDVNGSMEDVEDIEDPDVHGLPRGTTSMVYRAWTACAPVLAFISLLALIVMCVSGTQDDFAFRGGIIIASLLAVVLIAGTITPGSWMQDLMTFKPLAAFGRYSYGIYLWHWPMWILSAMVSVRLCRGSGIGTLFLTMAFTALAATFSWLMVEKPIAGHSVLFAIVPRGEATTRQVVRAIIVDVVLVASLVGCFHAVANAPERSSMQVQLEEQARKLGLNMRKEAHDADAATRENGDMLRLPAPPPRKPRPPMPKGDEITAIGDSVMLASAKGLASVFPGIQTDATVSRSMVAAPGMLQADLKSGSLRRWVMLGLGTNTQVTTDQLDQVHDLIGPNRVLVLVNAHGDRTWIPPTNQVMADYANTHSDNVVLVDWDAAAGANTQVLAADGIHPSMTSDLYAQTVKTAIEQWVKGRR